MKTIKKKSIYEKTRLVARIFFKVTSLNGNNLNW